MSNKKGENKKFSPCNFSPKNRRGSHVDVILSFIIFISFIIFLYAMIQPNITSKIGKTTLLDYMGGELIKNLTGTNLIAISLKVEPQNPSSCLQLTNFMANAEINSMSLVSKDLMGRTFQAYKSGNDLYLDMSSDENSELFKVYYSPSFDLIADNGLSNCITLQKDTSPDGYSINKKENYTSYYIWNSSISSLIDIYNNYYASVKDQFNLPPAENFGFSFVYQNQTVVSTNETIPTTVNVYSRTFPVAYVSANNNLEAGNLIVRVW